VKTDSSIRTIAFLGNYLPRKCGIATFTSDLLGAVAARHPQSRCFAAAVTEATQLPVLGTPFIVPASCPTCRQHVQLGRLRMGDGPARGLDLKPLSRISAPDRLANQG
jgi:hypothetical protein